MPSAKLGGAPGQARAALRAGLPRHAFDMLRADLGVTTEELADIVGISNRTLARRTERFKPDKPGRLLRVGPVLKTTLDVLEDPEVVRRWMTQPKRALAMPPVVTAGGWNFLLNPAHPDSPTIRTGPAMPFRPDPRLIR